MQIHFKSWLVKCHNIMQKGFVGQVPYYCDADNIFKVFVLSVSFMIQIYFLSVGNVP